MSKPKVIAFYLPQYHPTTENDEWWGKGFTEWTSVAKAKPLFRGHQQPKIPSELGFYDLRLPEARQAQAELAQEAGIYGFCYYHYWFNGRQLLNRPIDDVIECGKPDFPFCLCWANHTWYKKQWSSNNEVLYGKSKILIEQTYGGDEDIIAHFYSLLPKFKDKRYIKIKNRLLFMIYCGFDFDLSNFSKIWNNLSLKEGIPEFYFITHVCLPKEIEKIDKLLDNGFEAVNVSLHRMPFPSERNTGPGFIDRLSEFLSNHIRVRPETVDYKKALKYMNWNRFSENKIYPTIIPNWDHTPRSGNFGRVFKNSTPELFGKHIDEIFSHLKHKDSEDQIIFLKSWNEWGEGNYVEPDLINGRGYIEILKDKLK